jgi:hypothetical protein
MRPFLFIVVLAVCRVAPASAFQQPTNPWATIPRPPHAKSAPYDSRAERQLLDLSNHVRAEAGLAKLQSDEGLTRAARKHSALMASQKRLSHDLPGEPALPQRLAAASDLQFSAEGENVGLAPGAADGPPGVHEFSAPPRKPTQPRLQCGGIRGRPQRKHDLRDRGFRTS